MDKKSTIVWMVLFLALVMAWGPISNYLLVQMGYSIKPATQPTSPLVNSASLPASLPMLPTIDLATGAPTTAPATTTTTPALANTGTWAVVQPADPTAHTIGANTPADKTWAIGLSISPKGAGLEQAVINDYKLVQTSADPFTFEKPGTRNPDLTRSLAVRELIIDGTSVDVTRQSWSFAGQTSTADSQTLTYELTLARAGVPALTLSRSYTVYTRSATIPASEGEPFAPLGFEARVVTGFKNLTGSPMQVQMKFNAQGVPPTEAERGIDSYYLIGRAENGVVASVPWGVDSIAAEITDLLEKAKNRPGQVYWVGSTTTYFMSSIRFEPQQGLSTPMDWFESVDARALTPEAYGRSREVELVITAKPTTVAPGAESQIASRVYFGPKKREFLTNTHYAAPWIQYDRSLVITQGICGICTWQWLVNILFAILKGFHYITRDWGLAIIGLVILVRVLLHPISKKAQINMLKMGKLAPEMERIKKKHADDQEAMQREMMRFYRENGSTQIMGCLPMFLQMPVWIALWQAMNTTFELRHQPFFYDLTWIKDLSKPDHLIDFGKSYHVPLLSFVVISGINVLPFLFGALQFIQFKIQPKPPTMTPEQEQQQKMMQWMMLIMMPVLLYASPSGLMIYMITSFLLGILESKIVKKQFARMTEEEERFKLVEGDVLPATAQKSAVQKATVKRAGQPKKGGLMGMLEEIRERAAAAQREIEKNRKKGK